MDEMFASLHLRAVGGTTLTVVCVYAPNTRMEYSAFLQSLDGVIAEAPAGDSFVLVEDFNAHVGNMRILGGA